MRRTVFFAWQSWRSSETTRSVIQWVLEKAGKEIARERGDACVIDRDTQGLPGTPSIPEAIREKIAASDAFIGDVTPVTRLEVEGDLHDVPNPNVMVETGCAIERLGWDKMVVLMNTAHGDIRRLPFDLDRRRVLTYSLPDRRDDESQEEFWKRRAEARQQLLGTVTRALQVILDPAQERLGVVNLCGFLFHGSVEAVDSEAWTIRLVAPIGEHTLDPLELSSRLERAPQDFVATSRPGLARELSDRPTLRREGEHLIAVARVLPSQPRESASAIGRDIDLRSISNGDLAVTPGGVADIPRRLKQTLSIRRGGLVWQPAFGSFLSEYATDFDSSLLPDLIAAEVARLAFVPFAPGEPLALPFIRRVNSVQIGKGPNIQPMKVMFDLDVEPIGSWSGEAEVFLSPVEAMPRSGSR